MPPPGGGRVSPIPSDYAVTYGSGRTVTAADFRSPNGCERFVHESSARGASLGPAVRIRPISERRAARTRMSTWFQNKSSRVLLGHNSPPASSCTAFQVVTVDYGTDCEDGRPWSVIASPPRPAQRWLGD